MSMDNSALSGFGAVIGSGLDFALNNALADLAADRQFQNSMKMFNLTFDKQNRRQDFLNAMSGTIQKQSLKNAGLSAANLNGAPFSPNVASGAGISGSAEFAQANFFNAMLQAKQLQIQDKLADADIKLKQSEYDLNMANANEVAPNAESQRNYQNAMSAYYDGQVGLTSTMRRYYDTLDEQNRHNLVYNYYNFQKGLEKADSEIAANNAAADLSAAESIKAKVDAWHTARTSDAVLQNIYANTRNALSAANLNDAQQMEITQMLVPKMMALASQSDMYDKQSGLLDVEKLSTELQKELINKYGDTEKVVGMITDVIGALGNAFVTYGIFKGMMSPKVTTTTTKNLYNNSGRLDGTTTTSVKH